MPERVSHRNLCPEPVVFLLTKYFLSSFFPSLLSSLPSDSFRYALPAEGGGLRVWAATQGPDVAQKAAARAAGLKLGEVNIMNRRVGGGFGGKLTRQLPVIAAAGAAAVAFRRPVRVCLDRNTDLAMTGACTHMAQFLATILALLLCSPLTCGVRTRISLPPLFQGGRHEMIATFKAAWAVAASGGGLASVVGDAPPAAWATAAPLDVKLLALDVDIALDGGCTTDLSFFVNYAVAQVRALPCFMRCWR